MTTDEVRWLNDDERHTWLMLGSVLQELPGLIDAPLRHEAGINQFEYSILAGVAHSGGRRALSEITTFAGGSASRMSHAVSRLEKRGLMQRVRPEGGGRNIDLELTGEGRATLDRLAPGHVRQVRQLIFDALTPRQVRQLGDLAEKLLHHFDPDMAEMMLSEQQEG